MPLCPPRARSARADICRHADSAETVGETGHAPQCCDLHTGMRWGHGHASVIDCGLSSHCLKACGERSQQWQITLSSCICSSVSSRKRCLTAFLCACFTAAEDIGVSEPDWLAALLSCLIK